jgi:hypothetical protein
MQHKNMRQNLRNFNEFGHTQIYENRYTNQPMLFFKVAGVTPATLVIRRYYDKVMKKIDK